MEPPHLQPHGQQQPPQLQQHPPAVFYCQLCRAKLTLTGAYDGAEQQQRQPYMGASVFDSSKIDESFIVLDSSRRQAGAGLGGGMQLPMPGGQGMHCMLPHGVKMRCSVTGMEACADSWHTTAPQLNCSWRGIGH